MPMELEDLRIASPCSASWEAMNGDARSRHCEICDLAVYDLTALTRDEATRLVSEREGRLCVRFFRRRDGTVLTADCPVGFARVRRRLRFVAAAVAALIALIPGCRGSVFCLTGSVAIDEIQGARIPPEVDEVGSADAGAEDPEPRPDSPSSEPPHEDAAK